MSLKETSPSFFEAGAHPPKGCRKSPLFLHMRGIDIRVSPTGSPLLPAPPSKEEGSRPPLYLGLLDGRPVYAAELGDTEEQSQADRSLVPLRPLFANELSPVAQALARGRHLLIWDDRSRFCPGCGGKTQPHEIETAKVCEACGTIHYPVIAPAVITAVFQEDKILLAHNRHFREGLFSLIAGFVDAGETLEQAVAREIREEVGLEVTDIRYVSSQPWPFPMSLMLAFTARCPEGIPRPDEKEILDARWFSPEELPEIPAPGSVSRGLIDRFLDEGPF